MNSNIKNIVIVGGGITGLLSAIKLAELFDITIQLYEKNMEPTRHQIIVLNPSTFRELPVSIQKSPLFGCVNPVEYDQSGQIWAKSHAGQMCIEIYQLELLLLDHVKKLEKVVLNYQKLEQSDIRRLMNDMSQTLFIGADGFNSTTRQSLDCGLVEHVITYGLVCLFKGNTCRTDTEEIKNKYGVNVRNIMNVPQHRYRGFRSRSGQNQISIQLTYDEYQEIQSEKNFKASELSPAILLILQSAAKFYGFSLPPYDEIDITVLPIMIFNAELATHKINSNVILLMGDACNGPNFISMSGANKGIKMVRELVKLIKVNSSLDYIYANYERRVDYISIRHL